jgi:hypothetical protein
MRAAIVGTLVAVAALGAASTAHAATRYGGTALAGPFRLATPSIGLLLNDDGSISARASAYITCHGVDYDGYITRLKGAAHGTAFSATGHTSLGSPGRLTVKLSGTFAGAAATGKVKLSAKGCKGYTRKFSLRAASAPAGPPAVPAAQTTMFGITSQSAGNIPLPIALWVNTHGQLTATWEALAGCGDKRATRIPVDNLEPYTKIHSDGSFRRSEKYTIRYRDGSHDTIHAMFGGHFVSGGAVGTLRARVQSTIKHRLRIPCLSGAQTWSATM